MVITYQHTDMLGTPVMETDAEGKVVSRSVYEPFGKRLGGEKAGIGYTGHLQDTDLGLTYMQARYYDPLIGRFYSNDPIGFTGAVDTFNRYSYVANNPYKYTDPTGMTKEFDELREKRKQDKRNECHEDPNCSSSVGKPRSAPRQGTSGGNSSSSVPPLLQMALNDQGVSSSLSQAWEDSNPNAPSVLRGFEGSLKLEQGGWIVGSNGEFKVIRVAAGTRDSLGTTVGTRPSEIMVIAWFHTHPNTAAENYKQIPSKSDLGFTRLEAKAPGVVIQHNGMLIVPYR
ncbi:hypothetical protein JK628_15220 [Shewanella sp. KX20019]|nr:hypothetical protein JK628_15220 [Shewanella sp. KX20019]